MNQKVKFALYTGVFALFYSFCLYKNLRGVTFPFLVLGAIAYVFIVCKDFGFKWKKGSTVIATAIFLLSISQMLTMNTFINVFNVFGIVLLAIYLLLHQFAVDEKWHFWQHISNYFGTLFNGIGNVFAPFKDYEESKKNKSDDAGEAAKQKKQSIIIVITTIIVTFPVLCIIVALLSDVDVMFEKVLTDFLNWFNIDMILAALLSIIVFFVVYGIVARLLTKPYSEEQSPKKDFRSLAAITCISMFDLVYVIFSVIQIFYLFIGKFKLPSGYTYASYAREGFFQLLFISIFNLGLVVIALTLFKEQKLLKILLTIMCACTYIMTASSAFRMILYIRYYYFSFERILVLWSCFTIFIVVTGLLIQVWKRNFSLLKFCIITVTSCYLVLSFSRPDYFIAKWNLSQTDGHYSEFFLSDGYDDCHYLANLSEDAAPILLKDPSCLGEWAGNYHIDDETSIRKFNVSRYVARKLSAN